MVKVINKIITILFYLLFFLTPLVFYAKTSELFEFNKMVLTYSFAVLITGTWLVRMVLERKFIFRKTPLDIPLVIFLASQILSTIFSIDTRTSLLGYYSRFHGGLASSLSYAFLYWAYVSNLNSGKTKTVFKVLFLSAIVVSLWAIFEHFGKSFSCFIMPEFRTFDVSCWVQDVKNRVFATLGQPNWLAAWIIALIPITWAFALISKVKSEKIKVFVNVPKFLLWSGLSAVFFLTLIYTKSRSGLGAFYISSLAFWSLAFVTTYLRQRKVLEPLLKTVLIVNLALVLTVIISASYRLILIVNPPWATSGNAADVQPTVQGPALEVGGTESGKIRRIVWNGAIDIWKHYPILGTGVETFAFSYYNFRPVEHNLVSEWDYLYNKAHNEYLNFAATTGTIGLLSYLSLILFSIFQIIKKTNGNSDYLRFGIFAGYLSILITNFFGFSVVVVALQFFLYPAMAVSLEQESERVKEYKINALQKLGIIIACSFTILLFYSICRYWYADYLFAQGKIQSDAGNFVASRDYFARAVKLSPKEATFWDELSQTSATIAVSLEESGEKDTALQLSRSAIAESNLATSLSSANVNIKRDRAGVFIKLSVFNQEYLVSAKNALLEASRLAPTEAKIFYNLSISYLRTGDYDNAIKVMEEAVAMKPNYYDAHYALALMYIDVNEKDKAKKHLEYILTNINKDDVNARRELEELGI